MSPLHWWRRAGASRRHDILRRGLHVLLGAAAVSGSLLAIATAAPRTPGLAASPPRAPVTAQALAVVQAPRSEAPEAVFDPLSAKQAGALMVADMPDGRHAELTLDPGLQNELRELLRRYAVPYGAVVALEPASGRVLAYVSYSSANPNAGDLARDATAPSASVFKLVTAAALLEAGVGPDASACYGGGLHRLAAADIDDNPRRDRSCATLEQAIGGSINAVVAKLADRTLDRATLLRYATAFGFGEAVPFDAPTQPGQAEVPEERLERARTAAGFWHMHMSPLQGALIAATIANHGQMPRASMIARVFDAAGHELVRPEPVRARSVISPATAAALGKMMLGTVTHGTSRVAFHDTRGRPYLPDIAVAGKTGSLSSDQPFRAYSWWVGYAPEPAPEIALAALVVNTPEWRIKANQVARMALRYYLVDRKAKLAKDARAQRSAVALPGPQPSAPAASTAVKVSPAPEPPVIPAPTPAPAPAPLAK